MAREIISPKLDVVFKKLFIEHRDLLQSFIASILEIPVDSIKSLEVLNPEMPPEEIDGKFSRLDLLLNVDGTLINVEVQVCKYVDFKDRTLFYWSEMFTSGIKSGEGYGALKPAIAINILDFTLFKDREQYYTEVVAALKDTHEIFSDKFSIRFIELNKFKEKLDPNDPRNLWLQFLNAKDEEDFEMLTQTGNTSVGKAANVILNWSEDEVIRQRARIREKALRDEVSLLSDARAEGLAQGMAQGRAEERAAIAIEMEALKAELAKYQAAGIRI